ncbi:MAG: hypothetical protein FWC87_00040 [Acidimicrobiaceae bacterium]|nr:hypothetical protein [Acidimicrobiaceae bacterium]
MEAQLPGGDREALLAEYDSLEDRIEIDSRQATWDLADWLAANVPSSGWGGDRRSPQARSGSLDLPELAERRGRSLRWLQIARRVADSTAANRMPGITVRAYQAALEATSWTLEDANARLRQRGGKLRDQSPPMMSDQALFSEFEKRTPERQAVFTRQIVEHAPLARQTMRQQLADHDEANAAERHRIQRQAEEEGKQHRAPLQYFKVDGELLKAIEHLREGTRLAEGVDFEQEQRELLVDRVDTLRKLISAADDVIRGSEKALRLVVEEE